MVGWKHETVAYIVRLIVLWRVDECIPESVTRKCYYKVQKKRESFFYHEIHLWITTRKTASVLHNGFFNLGPLI